ncbi:YdcF family protein [Paenibacillus sp. UNC451MF]|uniref:YdcF family protein n=1 Tax=Paenibacillus sp. UNC451MF TaxID=1449063 RepID=UPI000A48DF7F|nr:YdcF family protein [Paenibacillus sp. UNC451MF]
MITIRISELDPDRLTIEQMTKLLFEGIADDDQCGDCIFVFGSNRSLKYRLPAAVDLYKKGRAPKLLLSGGNVWAGQSNKSEAVLMRDRAIELGVEPQHILIETESKHTKENVLSSLLVLDRAFMLHNIRRLLVVTSAYHVRRAHLTLKTYMPHWVDYTLCPVDDQSTRKDNWWLNTEGAKRVEAESRKIITYIKMGAIEDDVLP